MRVDGQRHDPAALPPGKRPASHRTGGWVGPRGGLDGCGKSDPRTVQPVASCYSITCIGQWKRRTFRSALLCQCLQWPRLFKRYTSNSEWALDAILFPITGTDIRCDCIPQYRYRHYRRFCSPIPVRVLDALLFPNTGTGIRYDSVPQYRYGH